MAETAKRTGGADHHLHIMLAGRDLAAIKQPLADAIHQDHVRQ